MSSVQRGSVFVVKFSELANSVDYGRIDKKDQQSLREAIHSSSQKPLLSFIYQTLGNEWGVLRSKDMENAVDTFLRHERDFKEFQRVISSESLKPSDFRVQIYAPAPILNALSMFSSDLAKSPHQGARNILYKTLQELREEVEEEL